jgi:HEPN domain-containing protein
MPHDREQAIRDLVIEWMRRARGDLVLAQMTDEEKIEPEILVFHAQQAAEKALKALLVKHQIDFPNTHSIGLLLNLCQKLELEGIEGVAEATTLTRYAVASRYPGEVEPVSRQEAREAADLAARLFTWVASLLD